MDDPERMAVLSGGMDDPDGVEGRLAEAPRPGDEGWDLDAGEGTRDEDSDPTE